MTRVFNFSPGPATLPEAVLRKAADEMLDWHGSGMSVMEMSHRGKEFISIHAEAEATLRELLDIPAGYKVLFMQGGAIGENAIVPLNLIGRTGRADYVLTGDWSKKSAKEAQKYGQVQVAEGEARAVDDAGNAKLEVTFLPQGLRWIPFTRGDYWILRLDPDYRTALVGEPARKYLWLLHRDPQMDAATMARESGSAVV